METTTAGTGCGVHGARLEPGPVRQEFRRCPPAAHARPGADRGRALLLLLRSAVRHGLPDGHRRAVLHPPHRAGQRAWRGSGDPGGQPARRHVRPGLPDGGAVRAGLCAQRERGQAGGDRRAAALRDGRAFRAAGRAALHALRAHGAACGRGGRRPCGPGLRARTGAAGPRRGAVRRTPQARRVERIRPRELQDHGRLRTEGDRMAALHRRHRAALRTGAGARHHARGAAAGP